MITEAIQEIAVMRNAATFRAYAAFGDDNGAGRSRSRFAGEVIETRADIYVLGERLYSPILRRFLNPDPVSPFSDGGINRYAYCGGDPINRVDPSGNSWRNWIGAILGLSNSAVGTAGGNSSLTLTSSTNGSSDAIASPVIVASGSSALMDAAAPLASIGSNASGSTNGGNGGGIFGWVSLGPGSAPGALTPLTRALTRTQDTARDPGTGTKSVQVKTGLGYSRTTHTSLDGDVRIDNYVGRGALLRKAPLRFLASFRHFRAEWREIPNANGGTNFVADSTITYNDVERVMQSLRQRSERLPITIFTGAHGAANGINWANGLRIHVNRGFRDEDSAARAKLAFLARSRDLDVVDLFSISNARFLRISNGRNIVVHAYCFGVADRELMYQHNISRAVTFKL